MSTNLSLFTEQDISGAVKDFETCGSLKDYNSNAAALLMDIFFPAYDLSMFEIVIKNRLISTGLLTTFILAAKDSTLQYGYGDDSEKTLQHYVEMYTRPGFMEKQINEQIKSTYKVDDEEASICKKKYKDTYLPVYVSMITKARKIMEYAEQLEGIAPNGKGLTPFGLFTGRAIIELLKPSSLPACFSPHSILSHVVPAIEIQPDDNQKCSLEDLALKAIGLGVLSASLSSMSGLSSQQKMSQTISSLRGYLRNKYNKEFFDNITELQLDTTVIEKWGQLGRKFYNVWPVELYSKSYLRNFRISYIGHYKTLRQEKMKKALDPALISDKVIEDIKNTYPGVDGVDISNPVKEMVGDILKGGSISGYSLTLFECVVTNLDYKDDIGQVKLANTVVGERNTRMLHLIGNLGIVPKDTIIEAFADKMNLDLKYKNVDIFEKMNKSRTSSTINTICSGKVPNVLSVESFDVMMKIPICEELYDITASEDEHEITLEDEKFINKNYDLSHLFSRYGGALNTKNDGIFTIAESRERYKKLIKEFKSQALFCVPVIESKNTVVTVNSETGKVQLFDTNKKKVKVSGNNLWSFLTLRHNKEVAA